LSLPLVQTRPINRKRVNRRYKRYRPEPEKQSQRIDAATLAANLQLEEQQRDLIYSSIALFMKLGLLLLGSLSLFRLGIASYQRVDQHAEVSAVLTRQSANLVKLQKRFDSLFTIGGDKRLMDEQDQWIAPNRIRVIWR